MRQCITEPQHRRCMFRFNPCDLFRSEIVAPTARLPATEEFYSRLQRRLLKSAVLFLLPQSGELRERHRTPYFLVGRRTAGNSST